MIFARKAAERLLDLVGGRLAANAERLIVVLEFQANAPSVAARPSIGPLARSGYALPKSCSIARAGMLDNRCLVRRECGVGARTDRRQRRRAMTTSMYSPGRHQRAVGGAIESLGRGRPGRRRAIPACPRRPVRRTPCAAGRSRCGTLRASGPRCGSGTRSPCGSIAIEAMRSPNSSCRRSSVPQSAGDFTPAGGGRYRPISLNSSPMKLEGRPVGQADPPARLADPRHFRRGLLLVGREHDAEGGQHDVEARVGERQVLGVRLLETSPAGLRRRPGRAPRSSSAGT